MSTGAMIRPVNSDLPVNVRGRRRITIAAARENGSTKRRASASRPSAVAK
jgi:hypothetical protein